MDMDALYDAAIAGDADAIAELEKQADGVNRGGETILHIESRNGKKKRVQFILREFVSKNLLVKFNLCKQTALHLAACHGRTEVAEVLIDAARKYLPSSSSVIDDQVTSFQVYVSKRNEDLNYTLHMTPSSANPIRSFEAFVRQADHNQVTALHEAVENGNMAIVKLLVEANPSDRHIQNYKGETPIYIAVEKGYIDILKVICTTCTAPSYAGPHGSTAFHAAIKSPYHSIQVVEVLISADNDNSTPDSLSCIRASLRQSDEDLNTALHIAVMEGKVAIAKLLVEADPSNSHTQNKEGKTPIYIAAEKGCTDIVTMICTTCTVLPNLDGPGARTTALHATIKNLHPVEKAEGDVIRTIINTFKYAHSSEDGDVDEIFVELFNKTDEHKCTILELAVELNYVDDVELILVSDPAYKSQEGCKFLGLVPLIYKAIERDSKDIVKLLSETYEDGARNTVSIYKRLHALISAIRGRQRVSVLEKLDRLPYGEVNFADNLGWTLLHHAAYHQFDSILSALVEAQGGYDDMTLAQFHVQESRRDNFVYDYMVSTPFHVAAKRGYTSTVIHLLELWPPSSSATFIAVDNMGQNILHLAALQSKKEMIQGILKHCPEKYMYDIVNKQDDNGNTPLHLLIRHGCFVPELIKHKGLHIMVKNKEDLTPLDNFYIEDEIIADQAQIKIALDDIETDQYWKFWRKNIKRKSNYLESVVLPSDREAKDAKFENAKKKLIDEKQGRMKKDLERYKKRTNTQIIVTALITTVTFTVGFTMPGGLYQSGGLDQGLVVLSKKTAFNAFMVSDALALLLSTCSLFLYFLESMYEDPRQVSKLNAASTGLNIVSVMAMMLTFITGTYVVLSHSLALAITVCLIGSFFFLFVIVLLIKMVYDRQVERNEE